MKVDTYSANGKPFNKNYWNKLYAEDENSIIDGIVNAKEHSIYLKSILDLQDIRINTLGDFGFGLGVLLESSAKLFKVKKIIGIDPSKDSVEKLRKAIWIHKYDIAIHHASLPDFHTEYLYENPLDLSICNSVFQYLPTDKVELAFLKLSRMTKYLYFCVPTENDYKMMKDEINFVDPYAYSRTREFYREAWGGYFRSVSHNLLESIENVPRTKFIFDLFRY